MDSKGRYKGPVPFQGIGTRLRRSRSREHSGDGDNLADFDMRSTLRSYDYHSSPKDNGNNGPNNNNNNNSNSNKMRTLGIGTLERPKRLIGGTVGLSGRDYHDSTFTATPSNGPLSGIHHYGSRSRPNLYEDSTLLVHHQYEEPQLLMHRDPIYDITTRNRQRNHQNKGQTPGTDTDSYNHYLDGIQSKTTVIPASALFGASKPPSGTADQMKCSKTGTADSSNSDTSVTKDSGFVPIDSITNSGSSSTASTADIKNQATLQHQQQQTPAGQYRQQHHTSNLHHSEQLNNSTVPNCADSLDRLVRPISGYNSSSTHSSSVMHTYANPFQDGSGQCRPDSLSYGEDTTSGPIIPDLSTLRPSQLLKNSYAGTGPVPPSLDTVSGEPNILTCLIDRLWPGRPEVKPPGDYRPGEHRCTWRLSTYALSVLVIVLFVILCLLGAYKSPAFKGPGSNGLGGHAIADGKVPCIVVEELDSVSTANHGLSIVPSPHQQQQQQQQHQQQQCHSALSRDPASFTEIFPGRRPVLLTVRLASYSFSSFWFVHSDPGVVSFQFKTPLGARLLLLGQRTGPPSLSDHEIFEIIADKQNGHRHTVRRRETILELDTNLKLDSGTWYFTVLSDSETSMTIVIKIAASDVSTADSSGDSERTNSKHHSQLSQQHQQSALDTQQAISQYSSNSCPDNCHSQGFCNNGVCQCFPGFMGIDCSNNVCPVLCNGRGEYIRGQCSCTAGWKGRECETPENHCEIHDCNGNGDCNANGICDCKPGYKGQHCEIVDCQPSDCSGRGICHSGKCHCRAGWTGIGCELADVRLTNFLPNCSGNGEFDLSTGRCVCTGAYFGSDCSETSCQMDCGMNGACLDGRCQCMDGWTGPNCREARCDSRCNEHGKCHNGTCHCHAGWMGKYCTLAGCPNDCSGHGRCVPSHGHRTDDGRHFLGSETQTLFQCQCDDSWGGPDCSAAQETSCTDEVDNDGDGLIDCADSECCRHEQCQHQLMCITSPDPLDVLLRKPAVSSAASFFQRVSFLIDDGSVQSYAQRESYSAIRTAVIRGQVVNKELKGLIGVRVSATSDPGYGFTLTRSDGWFDILVNGGGVVTLQFQRNPFALIKRSVFVSWNSFSVIDSPIVMFSVPDNGQEFMNSLTKRSIAFTYFDHIFGFDYLHEMRNTTPTSSAMNGDCVRYKSHTIRPKVRSYRPEEILELRNGPTIGPCNGHTGDVCVIAESSSVQSRLPLGDTDARLVYQSEMSPGYGSIMDIRLTPEVLPAGLKFVLLKIIVEGSIYERVFESDPDLRYEFVWNKRNVYKQKVYGRVGVKVHVGYVYEACPQIMWTVLRSELDGFTMDIGEIGGWNVDIQHRYNPDARTFQTGDGRSMIFDQRSQLDSLLAEPYAGTYMQSRAGNCETATHECGQNLLQLKFKTFSSLASSPDGAIFVGDGNLLRRISYDGQTSIVYEFRDSGLGVGRSKTPRIDYQLAYNPVDNHLYISDPERLQILRVPVIEPNEFGATAPPDPEVVIGTGQRCSPHDRQLCGDGRPGPEASLSHPKGLTFGLDGSLYFADGNLIRVLDSMGIVRTVAGQMLATKLSQSFTETSSPQSSPPSSSSLIGTTVTTSGTKVAQTISKDSSILNRRNQKSQTPPAVSLSSKESTLFGQPSTLSSSSSSSSPSSSSSSSASFIDCGKARLATQVKLHWPTSLTVSPLDGSLFFTDHENIYRLESSTESSSTRILTIVAGDSCAEHRNENYHFGSLAFDSTGLLYIADLGIENRVLAFDSQTKQLRHVAGFKELSTSTATPNQGHYPKSQKCSVERCNTLDGHNCTCLVVQDSSVSTNMNTNFNDKKSSAKLLKLLQITDIRVLPDNQLVIADQGALQLFKVGPYYPALNEQLEYSLLSPDGKPELFTFNQFGLHTATQSLITGRTVYSFQYSPDNVERLIEIQDSAGAKLKIRRDSGGGAQTLEHTPSGWKAAVILNRNGLLERLGEQTNRSVQFDYDSNGLIVQRIVQSSGETIAFDYCQRTGRLTRFWTSTGTGAATKLRHIVDQSFQISMRLLNDEQSSLFDTNSTRNHGHHVSSLTLLLDTDQHTIRFNDSDRSIRQLRTVLAGSGLVLRTGNGAHLLLTSAQNELAMAFDPLQGRLLSSFNRARFEDRDDKLSFDLSAGWRPIMRAGRLEGIQKMIKIFDAERLSMGQRLKIEIDWKTLRATYFAINKSDSLSLAVLQFDEHGRPLQLSSPNLSRDSSISLTYDPTGMLASWQRGHVLRTLTRDRLGRLVEVRTGERFVRFTYPESDPLERLPISVVYPSGHKYQFELHSSGRISAITTPKGVKHEIDITLMPSYRRFTYCPPIVDSTKSKFNTRFRCFELHYDDRNRLVARIHPYDQGRAVYRYAVRRSESREYQKDFLKMSTLDENVYLDSIVFAGGFIERWFDHKNVRDNRLIWSWQDREYSLLYKYHRNNGLLKHQTVQASGYERFIPVIFSYRYDSFGRLKTIQAKIGTNNMPAMEFGYGRDSDRIESVGPFKYFDTSSSLSGNESETLIGDGIGLLIRKHDSSGKIRFTSLTVNDKEVAKMDHIYDQNGALLTTRTFVKHVGKLRTSNYTFDNDGQLVEVQGREHWRFVYDFNGNLVTFLYLGNRIDIDYDQSDRVRAFGRGQDTSTASGTTPYVTDLRGFVTQRGDESLTYNAVGQLVKASRSGRYTIEYSYDSNGRLVHRRDRNSGNVTNYYYASTGNSRLVTHVVRGTDIVTLLYDVRNEILIGLQTVNGDVLYVFTDQTNSPVLVFDGRGKPIKEVHRSPFGHILFDSNPDLYIPVDFHGAIPDPVTNLLHFPGGRVYDSLSGRWLTPDVESLVRKNIVKNPKIIHLYRFANNDPTVLFDNELSTADNNDDDDVWSSGDAYRRLNRHTGELINRVTGLPDKTKLFERSNEYQTILSSMDTSLLSMDTSVSNGPSVQSYYGRLVEEAVTRIKNFDLIFDRSSCCLSQIQSSIDWTSEHDSWPLIVSGSGILPGFIIGSSENENYNFDSTAAAAANNEENRVQVRHSPSGAAGVKGQLLSDLLHNSTLVGRYHIDGIERLYFYRAGSVPKDLRSGAYRLLNITVQNAEDKEYGENFVDVLLYFESTSLSISVRFGQATNDRHHRRRAIHAERQRIVSLARKRSVHNKILEERQNLIQGRKHAKWSEMEKKFLLSASDIGFGDTGDKHDYAEYESSLPVRVLWQSNNVRLYDDTSNVRIVPAQEFKQSKQQQQHQQQQQR